MPIFSRLSDYRCRTIITPTQRVGPDHEWWEFFSGSTYATEARRIGVHATATSEGGSQDGLQAKVTIEYSFLGAKRVVLEYLRTGSARFVETFYMVENSP